MFLAKFAGQGGDHAPSRRVPRIEHHARARSRRSTTSSCSRPTRSMSSSAATNGALALGTAAATRSTASTRELGDRRRVHRDRPRAAVAARRRAGRPRSERLRRHRGTLDPHQPGGRVRRRRPRRPHLPAGDHRRRFGLPGSARRRVVSARQPGACRRHPHRARLGLRPSSGSSLVDSGREGWGVPASFGGSAMATAGRCGARFCGEGAGAPRVGMGRGARWRAARAPKVRSGRVGLGADAAWSGRRARSGKLAGGLGA